MDDCISTAIIAEIEEVLQDSGVHPYRFNKKQGYVSIEYPYHVDETWTVQRIMDVCRCCNVELRLKPKI